MLKKLLDIYSPLDIRTKEFKCYAPGSIALSISPSNDKKLKQVLEHSFIHSVNLKYRYDQIIYDISAIVKKKDDSDNYGDDIEYIYSEHNIDKLVVDSVNNVLHNDLEAEKSGMIKIERITFEEVVRDLNLPETLLTVSNTMYDDLLVAISKTKDKRKYVLDVGTRIELQNSSAYIERSRITSVEIYKHKILTYCANSANDAIYMFDVDHRHKHYKNASDIYLLRLE